MRYCISVIIFAVIVAFLPPIRAQGGFAPLEEHSVVPNLRVILIGTDHYEHLENLRFPASDIKLLQGTFEEIKGRANIISLVALVDKKRKEILAEVQKVAKEADESKDLVIIYWSGHSGFIETSKKLILGTTETLQRGVISRTYETRQYVAKPNAQPIEHKTPQEDNFDDTIDFVQDLLGPFRRNQKILFFGDGCNIGEALIGNATMIWPRLSVLSSSKTDESTNDGLDKIGHSLLSYYLSEALKNPIEDLDRDGLISVDELFIHIYPRVLNTVLDTPFADMQHPAMFGRFSHKTWLAVARPLGSDEYVSFNADDFTDKKFFKVSNDIRINGVSASSPLIAETSGLRVSKLDAPKVRDGLNVIEVKETPTPGDQDVYKRYLVWKETNKLKDFRAPYGRSHALLFVMSDFERKDDPQKRGPAGLESVPGMLETTHKLGNILRGLGFEVFEIYNKDVTAANIDAYLRKYWPQGEYENVDRLFIYFGTHGMSFKDQAGREDVALATYDYDKSKVLATTYHTADLMLASSYIAAKHIMFAIDACSAGFLRLGGLPIPNPIAESNEKRIAYLKQLTVFHDESQKKARNVLVAGTGDQESYTVNGESIFALKLIEALQGGADNGNKGYWTFSEVASHVKTHVSIEAGHLNQIQIPRDWKLTAFGDGEMLFFPSADVTPAKH